MAKNGPALPPIRGLLGTPSSRDVQSPISRLGKKGSETQGDTGIHRDTQGYTGIHKSHPRHAAPSHDPFRTEQERMIVFDG